jgi:transcriptional antiterminator RfaH
LCMYEMEGKLGQGGDVRAAAPAIAEAAAHAMAWYCVRSQPKHEHVAAANLRRNRGFEVLNPRIRFKRPTCRGLIWVIEPVFPTYLFARFDWSSSLNTVIHTHGVSGVVHFGSHWPILPDQVIQELQELVGPEEVRVLERRVRVGDEVEIIGGGFAGLSGVVTRVMPARERVAVLMNFFGRQTVIEVGVNTLINRTAQMATQLL